MNSDDYEGGANRAVSALQRLASEGGYVCAHYAEYPDWLVGYVPPNSRIRRVRGRWKQEHLPKGHDGIAIIKTLRLEKSLLIAPYEYAALQAAQPRQGTLMRWPSAGDYVESIVCKRKRLVTFDRLGTCDQELMCTELLRQVEVKRLGLPRLVCLLRHIGRTMKDLDILGVAADGKRVMAQVTHCRFDSVNAKWKLDCLRKFRKAGGVHLLLFCDCDERTLSEGVVIYPIRDVFKRFTQMPVGRLWRKHLV